MKLFDRRRAAPNYVPESQDAAGAMVPVYVFPTGVPNQRDPLEPGPADANAWAPGYGTPNASQQIGNPGRGTVLLSQFPAMVVGVQRHQGREFGNSGWYYPALTSLPNGSVTQTTKPNNVTGGQRYGSIFSGPLGPLSSKKLAANVNAAQVRQSGLAAMEWAQGLRTPGAPSD